MHFPYSLFSTTFVLGLGSANGGALGEMGPSCLVKLESLSHQADEAPRRRTSVTNSVYPVSLSEHHIVRPGHPSFANSPLKSQAIESALPPPFLSN